MHRSGIWPEPKTTSVDLKARDISIRAGYEDRLVLLTLSLSLIEGLQVSVHFYRLNRSMGANRQDCEQSWMMDAKGQNQLTDLA